MGHLDDAQASPMAQSSALVRGCISYANTSVTERKAAERSASFVQCYCSATPDILALANEAQDGRPSRYAAIT